MKTTNSPSQDTNNQSDIIHVCSTISRISFFYDISIMLKVSIDNDISINIKSQDDADILINIMSDNFDSVIQIPMLDSIQQISSKNLLMYLISAKNLNDEVMIYLLIDKKKKK